MMFPRVLVAIFDSWKITVHDTPNLCKRVKKRATISNSNGSGTNSSHLWRRHLSRNFEISDSCMPKNTACIDLKLKLRRSVEMTFNYLGTCKMEILETLEERWGVRRSSPQSAIAFACPC